MSSTPDADPALVGATDLALAALHEITPAHTVGEPVGHRVEAEGVVSLLFANRMPGYPNWLWTVTLARVDEDAEPTVLEVELLPAEGALVAPDWVPWSVRLAEYQRQQAELAAAGQADDADAATGDDSADDDADDLDDELEGDEDEFDDEDEDSDEFDDTDDLDAADFDTDGSPLLHSGDVDGVDLEEAFGEIDDEDDEEEAVDREKQHEEFSDEDFVSDEDDLGEEELQDPEN